jgi:hypothetical protein
VDGPHRAERGVSGLAAVSGTGAALLVVLSAGPPRLSTRRLVLAPAPRRDHLEAVGRAVTRRIGVASHPPSDRAIGRAVAAAAPLAVLVPPLAVVVVLGAVGHRWWDAHRAARARADAVRRGLPDLVDLLRLCTTGGLSLPLAHAAVAPRVPPPLGPALHAAEAATRAGAARADALLDSLRPLGERAAALAQVLADHLRYGVPLGPALDRLALELRLDRRRHAEQAARRVPVRLLAPLVACTLPAFALLTVVPLLGASLQGLPV